MNDPNPAIGRGAFWNGVTAAANQVIRFTLFMALARLVAPAELGLVALGLVVIDLLQALATFGIGDAVVQQPHLDDEQASTAFWLSIGLGAAVALAVAVSAPVIALLAGKPPLAPVIASLSPMFLFASLQTVHLARLAREFRFRQIALRMLVANLVGGGRNLILGSQVASTTLVGGAGNILIGTDNLVDTPGANTSDMLQIKRSLAEVKC